ncbi:MAG: hypothetical protein ACO3A2_04190 [Bdellovibrionia bacterium]
MQFKRTQKKVHLNQTVGISLLCSSLLASSPSSAQIMYPAIPQGQSPVSQEREDLILRRDSLQKELGKCEKLIKTNKLDIEKKKLAISHSGLMNRVKAGAYEAMHGGCQSKCHLTPNEDNCLASDFQYSRFRVSSAAVESEENESQGGRKVASLDSAVKSDPSVSADDIKIQISDSTPSGLRAASEPNLGAAEKVPLNKRTDSLPAGWASAASPIQAATSDASKKVTSARAVSAPGVKSAGSAGGARTLPVRRAFSAAAVTSGSASNSVGVQVEPGDRPEDSSKGVSEVGKTGADASNPLNPNLCEEIFESFKREDKIEEISPQCKRRLMSCFPTQIGFEIRALEIQNKECEETNSKIQTEIAEIKAELKDKYGCVNCTQNTSATGGSVVGGMGYGFGMMGPAGFVNRVPSKGEVAMGVIAALTPAMIGGMNLGAYAIGQNAYSNMYSNYMNNQNGMYSAYVDANNWVGVPSMPGFLSPPGYMGGFGFMGGPLGGMGLGLGMGMGMGMPGMMMGMGMGMPGMMMGMPMGLGMGIGMGVGMPGMMMGMPMGMGMGMPGMMMGMGMGMPMGLGMGLGMGVGMGMPGMMGMGMGMPMGTGMGLGMGVGMGMPGYTGFPGAAMGMGMPGMMMGTGMGLGAPFGMGGMPVSTMPVGGGFGMGMGMGAMPYGGLGYGNPQYQSMLNAQMMQASMAPQYAMQNQGDMMLAQQQLMQAQQRLQQLQMGSFSMGMAMGGFSMGYGMGGMGTF